MNLVDLVAEAQRQAGTERARVCGADLPDCVKVAGASNKDVVPGHPGVVHLALLGQGGVHVDDAATAVFNVGEVLPRSVRKARTKTIDHE